MMCLLSDRIKIIGIIECSSNFVTCKNVKAQICDLDTLLSNKWPICAGGGSVIQNF